MKKLLFTLTPLLFLILTLLPFLDSTFTTKAQRGIGIDPNNLYPSSAIAPPPPSSSPNSSPNPSASACPPAIPEPTDSNLPTSLPTVAIWGDPGPSPDFTDVDRFSGAGKVYSDKLDYSVSPPRHCLYWEEAWKYVQKQVKAYNYRYKQNLPIPGEGQIFVYRDAPENMQYEISHELAQRYITHMQKYDACDTTAIEPTITAKDNKIFEIFNLIDPSEYVCEDPTAGYCMYWHNEEWCPKNKPGNNHKYAQCAAYDKDGACKEVLTSLSDTPVKTEPGELIRIIFLVTLSLAGGVAVLLIIAAGYKILTSSGKPESIQAGREQLTSALVGLLFIIFSYVIFQFIVADLLKIPGITN